MTKKEYKNKDTISTLTNPDTFPDEDESTIDIPVEDISKTKTKTHHLKNAKSGADETLAIFARLGTTRFYQIFFVVFLTATFAIAGIYGLISSKDGLMFSRDVIVKRINEYPSEKVLQFTTGFHAYNIQIIPIASMGETSVLEVHATLVNATRLMSRSLTIELRLYNENRSLIAIKRVLYNVSVPSRSSFNINVIFEKIPSNAMIASADIKVIAVS